MNTNPKKGPLTLTPTLAAALLLVAGLATPVSAGADAGAGAGCTATWAQGEASGDAWVTATADMKGARTDHGAEGSPGGTSGYYKVWSEGEGGGTATAHGEDTQGRSADASCNHIMPTPPPPGSGDPPGAGDPEPSDPCRMILKSEAQGCLKRILKGIYVTALLKGGPEVAYEFDGTVVLMGTASAGYELGAIDTVRGAYIMAQDGVFRISSPADFLALEGISDFQVLPVSLHYRATEILGHVTVVGSISPT